MKTLINKRNPQVKITAPEINIITSLGYTSYEIKQEGTFSLLFSPDIWTLVEEEENTSWAEKLKAEIRRRCRNYIAISKGDEYYIGQAEALDSLVEFIDSLVEEKPAIVEIIKKFVEKGERCMQQAVEDQNPGNYTFWDGFHNCAENILREVEESTEGIRGKSKEIPAIKSKEIKSKLISAVKAQFYPGPEKEQIIQWIQNANL